VLALFAALDADRRRSWAIFRPSALWKSALPGSVLGMYVCLLLWFAGFKYTHPAVAAALNQTSVVFAIILASIFLKEVFTRRKLAAAVLALVGVAVVTCAGWFEARWQALFQASPGG
jgi:drug/metabolite transporter (DMT)-like permease